MDVSELGEGQAAICLETSDLVEHGVQFYRDPRFLIDTALRFAAGGLAQGEGVVVLASREHLAAIRSGLAPRESLVLCEAEELLDRVLGDELALAPGRLRGAIHGLFEQARAGDPGRRLRVHTELAEVLWRRRRMEGVLQLEELWSELAQESGARLLCAYCLGPMARSEYRATFDAVCERHGTVAPTEAWRGQLEPAGGRSLASLEQRAAALEGELIRREWATWLGSELQRTSAALGGLVSEREAAEEVVRVGLAALGGGAGGVWLLDASGTELELVHEVGLSAAAVSRVGRLPADGERFRPDALFVDPEAAPPGRDPTPAELQLLTELEGPVAILPLGTDRGLGSLVLQAKSLEPEERTFLSLLAQSCSQALERARAWARERQARELAEAAHRETRRLFELAEAAGRAEDVADLYEPVLAALIETLRVERAAILLLDGDGAMRFKAWRGLTDGHRAALEGHAPWATGEADLRPVFVSDVAAEPGWEGHAERGIRALGFVPLAHQRQLLGQLLLCSDAPRTFHERELQLVRSIASQVSQALARARLLERERISRDAAESAQQRTTFLLQASVLLASSLEWRETLGALADLAVPRLADWCAIDVGEGERLVSLAIAHEDPARVELARRLRQERPFDPAEPNSPASVLRSGEPLLLGHEEPGACPAPDSGEHAALLARLGIRSALIVPMSARGRTFGTITLAMDGSGRAFGLNDLELAELLGRRAGIAIENARLYAEAQSATQSREEILAVVSHDLRNPLGAILTGAAGLLETEISERRAPRIKRGVETIHRAGERMARLIDDLVDFASLHSGRLGIERGDCLIGEMIESALEMFLPLAEERGLRLETVVPPDRPVHCDRDRVIQVLANLLANALKVTAPGGLIHVGAAERSGALVFFVEDTGPGIGPDDLPRLFERYWRGKATYKGTGLGLTIARGIVEAHGGRIWAESQVGVGSTFSFTVSPVREVS